MNWKTAIPIICVVAVLFGGCSAEQRLSRLLANHPELHRTDTIRDTVEAIVEYVHMDTVWKVTTDTLRLDKDRLHVRTVIQHDTVWQEAWCDPDTIRVPIAVTVERLIPCPPGYKVKAYWRTVALTCGSLLFILLLIGAIMLYLKR